MKSSANHCKVQTQNFDAAQDVAAQESPHRSQMDIHPIRTSISGDEFFLNTFVFFFRLRYLACGMYGKNISPGRGMSQPPKQVYTRGHPERMTPSSQWSNTKPCCPRTRPQNIRGAKPLKRCEELRPSAGPRSASASTAPPARCGPDPRLRPRCPGRACARGWRGCSSPQARRSRRGARDPPG